MVTESRRPEVTLLFSPCVESCSRHILWTSTHPCPLLVPVNTVSPCMLCAHLGETQLTSNLLHFDYFCTLGNIMISNYPCFSKTYVRYSMLRGLSPQGAPPSSSVSPSDVPRTSHCSSIDKTVAIPSHSQAGTGRSLSPCLFTGTRVAPCLEHP